MSFYLKLKIDISNGNYFFIVFLCILLPGIITRQFVILNPISCRYCLLSDFI